MSEYRLEIHSDLVADGQWYLHVILLLLFIAPVFEGGNSPSSFGESEETGELLWRQH